MNYSAPPTKVCDSLPQLHVHKPRTARMFLLLMGFELSTCGLLKVVKSIQVAYRELYERAKL